MFEMKNEMDTTATKHKNEDFYEGMNDMKELQVNKYICDDERRILIFMDMDAVMDNPNHKDVSDKEIEDYKAAKAKTFHLEELLSVSNDLVKEIVYDWNLKLLRDARNIADLGNSSYKLILVTTKPFDIKIDDLYPIFRVEWFHDCVDYIIFPSDGETVSRKDLIEQYLFNHPDMRRYVVLDSDYYRNDFPGRFIQIRDGELSQEFVNRARRILRFGPNFERRRGTYGGSFDDKIRKVIFLDFDGVLNDEGEEYNSGVIVNEEAIRRLKRIVDATGANIIMTSSRRFAYADFVKNGYQVTDRYATQHMAIFQELLEKYDLYIDGITGEYESGPKARPLEIRTWLLPRAEIKSFVILDDDNFWMWRYMEPHFVRTVVELPKEKDDWHIRIKKGLTDEHVEKAIRILNMYDGQPE